MDSRPLFVNGRFLTQRITGTQRYAHEILIQLDSMLDESATAWPEVTILVPPHRGTMPTYKRLKLEAIGRHTGRWWEQVELPFRARAGVLFTPCGGAPILHPRNIITIHDAAVFAAPSGYSAAFLIWYRFLYWTLCHTALHIFTVSQFSKKELVKRCGAIPCKVSVSYLGSEHAHRQPAQMEILREYGIRPFEYVFTVSSRTPNKNIDGLLHAFPYFSAANLDLVVAGAENVAVFGERSDFPSSVIDVGYVTDGALRALYENAACFVFPSFYEGFGLPPLEAMALGCPTVVSSATSLAEIFGTVALLCNPDDPRDIAARIVEATHASEEYKARCRHFGSIFKWDRCAQKTWGLIAEFCVDRGAEAVWKPAASPLKEAPQL